MRYDCVKITKNSGFYRVRIEAIDKASRSNIVVAKVANEMQAEAIAGVLRAKNSRIARLFVQKNLRPDHLLVLACAYMLTVGDLNEFVNFVIPASQPAGRT